MEEKIRSYVVQTFLGGRGSLELGQPLFSTSLIDSLGHMRLVAYLEREFGVTLSPKELRLENFDTVASIASLIRAKLAAKAGSKA